MSMATLIVLIAIIATLWSTVPVVEGSTIYTDDGDNFFTYYANTSVSGDVLLMEDESAGYEENVISGMSYSIIMNETVVIEQINAATAAYDAIKDSVTESTMDYTSEEAVAAFNAKGYIYPWRNITDQDIEDREPLIQPQKFNTDGNYTDLPNIVFLMFDDLGWNNVNLGVDDSTVYPGLFTSMDTLVKDGGITFTNYFTGVFCTPGRAMFLTGKYSSLIAMDSNKAQLAVRESTLAIELKSAGYNTAMVGKWDVGLDHPYLTPTYKGFDYYTGYHSSQIEKISHEFDSSVEESIGPMGYNGSYVDFWMGTELLDDSETSETWAAYHFSQYAEEFTTKMSEDKDGRPFFLYYASDLPHQPFEFPNDTINERCKLAAEFSEDNANQLKMVQKCRYMAAVDEVVANLTCHFSSELGQEVFDNTLFILASDNGGDQRNDNLPYRGQKYYGTKGGFSAPAAIFGSLVPEEMRGTINEQMIHVTDWMPTLMHVASRGEWKETVAGDTVNGVNQWGSVMEGDVNDRVSTIQYVGESGRTGLYSLLLMIDVGDYMTSYHEGILGAELMTTEIVMTTPGDERTSCDVGDITYASSTTITTTTATITKTQGAAADLLSQGAASSSFSSRWPAAMGASTLLVAVYLMYRSSVANNKKRDRTTTTEAKSKGYSGVYGTV
jgi:arylsulfatase A-like enzyme